MRLWATLFLAASGTALAAAPCPHRYFPLEEGLALAYRAGGTELTATYSDAARDADAQKAKLTLVISGNGKTGMTQALCDAKGVGTEAGGLGVLALQSAGMDVKITESQGVILPPLDQVKSGQPWSNRVSVEMSPPASVNLPGGMKPVIRTTFVADASFVAEEKVTTAGGTFDALKIKTRTTAVAGSTGSERSIESFLWFADGIGLVKVMTGDNVDLELTGVKRTGKPAVAKGAKSSKGPKAPR